VAAEGYIEPVMPDVASPAPVRPPPQGLSRKQRELLVRLEGESSSGDLSDRERFRRLLYRLRWQQRLTGMEIAELAGTDGRWVERWFRLFEVRRRDPAPEGF
jgi:hypothetical protein